MPKIFPIHKSLFQRVSNKSLTINQYYYGNYIYLR